MAPTRTPQTKPVLPKSGIPWKLPRSDYFDKSAIELSWHFLNKNAASRYSLTEKPGWLTLNPGTGSTHILHKEAGHYYTLVTKLDFDATENGQQAGIYLTNGNESFIAGMYSGYNDGKKIGFRVNDKKVEIENTLGNVLWLRVERYEHQLRGAYSTNGISWTQLVSAVSAIDLDKTQENYNHWVGTSNGLYTNGKKAHFDLYVYRDGFSPLPVVGYNNYYGLEVRGTGTNKSMTNSSDQGGWLILGGVDLGQGTRVPAFVEVEAASTLGGTLEVWIDDLGAEGTKVATIDISTTGSESTWKKFRTNVTGLSGQHDIYLSWSGPEKAFLLKNIRFIPNDDYLTNVRQYETENRLKIYPNPVTSQLNIENHKPFNSLTIYNIHGQIVLEKTFGYPETTVSLPVHLKKGVYLLQVFSEGQPITTKFIVE